MASFPPTPAGNQCHRLFRRLGPLGHVSRIDSKGCQYRDQPSEQPRLPHQRPKSHLPPSTDVVWLGIRWFPLLGRWALLEDKQMSILSSIRHVLSLKQVTRRQWEHILGKLTFATQILRHNKPLLQPLLRPQILSNHLHRPKTLSISPHFHHSGNTIHLWTDASLSGWGGHTLSHYVSGTWDTNESTLHINCLEVRVVLLTIRSLNLSNCQLHQAKMQINLSVTRNLNSQQPSQLSQNSHTCFQDFFPPKFKGGQPEQTFNHHNRVVTSKTNLQGDSNMERPIRSRSNVNKQKQEATSVLLPSSRPKGSCLECTGPRLEQMESNLSLPSKVVTPSGAEETGILPSPRSDNSSLVSNGALV
ncbi:hypothetical protein Pcinc_002431 [Petrolisthes cinctipes]|uniref:Uncharacterized protein n=1 Tax=Petrolisthes cinctipes TaxID=88211 RepID=A0AAE1GIR1_PETCI|nr:hypothetical protein Pcinc_002431 [Petrolisthes cinctipes]